VSSLHETPRAYITHSLCWRPRLTTDRLHQNMLVLSKTPLNAETPCGHLDAGFITPQPLFYIRSHGDIPRIDEVAYRMTIGGIVGRPMELTTDQIRNDFTTHKVVATMQCAGNRRADMDKVKPVTGDLWRTGAIGNAEWTGVRLADVLRAAGAVDAEDLHVAFASYDEVEIEGQHFNYGVSIPMPRALSPDVLLAFKMNDEPLAPAHGFPLRVVVPGYAGVRSPKWLSKIEVQGTPSENHMQQQDYKMLPPHMSKEDVEWTQGVTINEMLLTSAICTPQPNTVLKAGKTTISGYAIASDRSIARVDVSTDGGSHWLQAQIRSDAARWSWVLWHAEIMLTAGPREIVVRAWDSAGQTQPSNPAHIWNFKGYLSAAWHRVAVRVE
jgi:sulfite oxidase